MSRLVDLILDRLAFVHDWGWSGLLQRMRWGYLRHRFMLYRTERQDAFDHRFGTETSRKLRTSRMNISPQARAHAEMYWATPASQFLDMLNVLPETPEQFTFIDLGCGKGRVLLLALQAGFRSVIGVELSAQLAEVARRNIETGRREINSHANCVVFCADAVSLMLPDEDCVLYLFNPFDHWTLRRVLDNALAVRRACGRRLVIACMDLTPEQLDVLELTRELSLAHSYLPVRGPVNAGSFSWYIYEYCMTHVTETHHAA